MRETQTGVHRSPPQTLSILMATHAGEQPQWLRAALASVFDQTMPAEECVLVLDGPVGAEHEAIIAGFAARPSPTRLIVLRLPCCQGLAAALNAGLPHCSAPLIARMDSDDLSLPHRFAVQRAAFERMADIDVLCAWSAEFEDSPTRPWAIKTTPAAHDAIAATLKWRCAITHPSIVIRKAMLERVGGYRGCFGDLADYDLYVRVLMAGGRFAAIQQPLVLFRVSHQQRVRRGGWAYARRELAFRRFCHRAGFLSLPELVATAAVMAAFRLTPPWLKKELYRLVRAKPAAGGMDVPSYSQPSQRG